MGAWLLQRRDENTHLPSVLGIVPMVVRCAARHDLVDFIRETVRDLQCVSRIGRRSISFTTTLRTLGVRNNVAFIAALFFAITTPVCVADMAILTLSLSVFSLLLESGSTRQ